MGLFDERNLFELDHPDFPGERLVACRNPELAELRAHKRADLLIEATSKELEKVRGMVGKGRLKGADKIGVRVGKVVNKYKVAKHFELDIGDDSFGFSVNEESVAEEAALDGIYVVRTSLPKERMSGPRTRCETTRGSATSSAPSAPSKRWTCSCGPSTTGPRTGSAPTSSCACSPTTCSGT